MKKPKSTPIVPTFEAKTLLIQSVMDRYLPEDPHGYYTGQGVEVQRAIRWGFGLVQPKSSTSTSLGEYVLTILVRRGAFGETKRMTRTKWWSLTSVTEAEVTNALFTALAFSGSPYHFDGKKWRKRTELMG